MDYWTAFVLGLAGSLHCAAMCGPLALALPTAGRNGLSLVVGRCAYTIGRIATYCALGLVFGLAGRTLALAGIQRWVSIALGLTLLTGLFASRHLALWRPVTRLIEQLKRIMAGQLRRRSLAALALLGLLNGLLPCGLVYVACAGATATGGIASGAVYMTAFGLGTAPLMLAISFSGRLLPLPVRLRLRAAIPVSVFLLGLLLILRGMSLGIPYVSPRGSVVCCHN
jgi:sulfite exporter TauE/SafE